MHWSVIYQLIKINITLIFTDCEHVVNFVVTFMREIKGNSTSCYYIVQVNIITKTTHVY